jgi:hypothetical protein
MKSAVVRGLTMTLLLATIGVVSACTHDFASFESTNDLVTAGDAAIDAGGDATGARPTDGAVANTPDAAPCAAASTCHGAALTCVSACEQTHGTCVDKCGSGSCRRRCDDDRTTCNGNCTSTCQACAGASCSSVCN